MRLPHPRNNRLIRRVVTVERPGVDAAERTAAGQRVVQVELPNRIDIRTTYPRNLRVRDCR